MRSRCWARVGAVAVAVGCAAATATPSLAALSGASSTALPVVDMEATVKAAQIDPRRADHTLTAGARASVLAVEQALQATQQLDARWVDGYFGSETVKAYARFQRSLGATGIGANGLPSAASLTTLSRDRFAVRHRMAAGARVHRDGFIVDARTLSMLGEAERKLRRSLLLDQGSYNPGGDPTSAGTHDGGGVIDVSVQGMTVSTRTAVVRALRQVGFAAWLRNPSQGNWPWHIHAAAISDPELSVQAQHQVGDYYLGKNGLASRAPDDGPRVPIRTWEEYQRGR